MSPVSRAQVPPRRGPCRGTVPVDDDRSAALLVRVWVEGGTGDFRCRLTTIDTSGGAGSGQEVTLAVASSPGDALVAVRQWLDGFLDATANPIDIDP
jgi:hypothetical protein